MLCSVRFEDVDKVSWNYYSLLLEWKVIEWMAKVWKKVRVQ